MCLRADTKLISLCCKKNSAADGAEQLGAAAPRCVYSLVINITAAKVFTGKPSHLNDFVYGVHDDKNVSLKSSDVSLNL